MGLLLVAFPLLLIARYDFPSADDWSHGINAYKVLQQGGNLPEIINAVFLTVKQNYLGWDGRFSAVFFNALQPGIWGEQYYGIVPWIMIGGLIISESLFCGSLFRLKIFDKNNLFFLPIILPVLIMQIVFCPSPEESIYWYTGSIGYAFMYSLSLVLITLFINIANTLNCKKYGNVLKIVAACILAVLVGGGNYATSLSCFLTLLILEILFWFFDRNAFFKTFYITLIMGVCIILSIIAPGNANRISSNFGNETKNVFEAIILSLWRSFTNIYSWTSWRTILLILFIIPFIWMAVKGIDFMFRFPALFTIISFGIYASQATATMYVDGTTGGGRMAAILYYSYFIWLVSNISYWLGWLAHKDIHLVKLINTIGSHLGRYLILYCGVISIILIGLIYRFDLKSTTVYRAYRDWRQGWAQQYAVEWEERLEVLHNEEIEEVYFEPLSVYPEMLLYTDLQPKDGYYWVNSACAAYYDKVSVDIIEEEGDNDD